MTTRAFTFQSSIFRAIAECTPNVATRILPTESEEPIFGLKYMQNNGLTPTHIGYLAAAILDAASAAKLHGRAVEVFVLDESRGSIAPFQQGAFKPCGRLLFCAVGSEAASTLEAIAAADRDWNRVEGLFDMDGALRTNRDPISHIH